MATIDLDALLAPITAEQPAGEDLEYDLAFLAALEASRDEPERMVESVSAASEPDWAQVLRSCGELFPRTKDLRIGVLMTRALLHIHGLPGLAAGLTLVRRLVTDYWQDVHPGLDPDDNNDPTARVNALLGLCGREQLLQPLRNTTLVHSRVFGAVHYRDIEVAHGKAPPPDAAVLDQAAIAGAFQDCAMDALRDSAGAAADALRQTRGLGDALAERIGDAAPSFEPLLVLLTAIDGVLRSHLAAREPSPEDPQVDAPASNVAPAAVANARAPGPISSREDVVRTLDLICEFYARQEPSSPVPLLLRRARRLATGSFVDIVRDLAPDAMPQIEKVCGLEEET